MAHRRPPFVQEVRLRHAGERVEVWFQDEARIGQQGTLTNIWAQRGSRPTAVKQTEYDWLYLFAAVNPVNGASSAMIAPGVDTQWMNNHLAILSQEAGPGVHVVLVLDGAGWHVAKALKVPGNITLLHLPPYSPELNPVERVWGYMRSHHLSNHAYKNYDALFKHVSDSRRKLDADRLRSLTNTQWITHVIQG